MKLKISTSTYFILYFFLLMSLYFYKIRDYFYWVNIADKLDTFFDFSFSRFFLAVAIFFVNLYFVNKLNKRKLYYIVICIIFTILTIPSLITFTSENMYPVKLMVFHQILFFAMYGFSRITIDFRKIPTLSKKQALILLLMITVIGTIPYLIVYGPHINLRNLLLQQVYLTRNIMKGLSNPYFGYTYSLFTRIIIPLIIVFALELKNRTFVIVGVLYLILFYLFGAHKTVYAGLIVILVFYRLNYFKAIKLLLKYSNLLIVLCIFLAFVSYDYLWILSFRRVHFLPALLDISYLDFFENNHLYWSESVLKSFIDYPYDIRHTNLIGKEYFFRDDVSANNGMISDGFMNFGAIGVFINVFLTGTYFMILNNLNIPPKYFGLYMLVIFSFISSSLSTVFLTHGAIVLLLISIFLLKTKQRPL